MKNIETALTSSALIIIGSCLKGIPRWLIPNIIAHMGWVLIGIGIVFMINLVKNAFK